MDDNAQYVEDVVASDLPEEADARSDDDVGDIALPDDGFSDDPGSRVIRHMREQLEKSRTENARLLALQEQSLPPDEAQRLVEQHEVRSRALVEDRWRTLLEEAGAGPKFSELLRFGIHDELMIDNPEGVEQYIRELANELGVLPVSTRRRMEAVEVMADARRDSMDTGGRLLNSRIVDEVKMNSEWRRQRQEMGGRS